MLNLAEDKITELATAAGAIADQCLNKIKQVISGGLSSEVKGDKSLVTRADTETEKLFRQLVAERYPAHGVIGEEFPATNPQSDFQWIIDPVDGTEELAFGVPTYGMIIGVHYRGEPVLGIIDMPALSDRYQAITGRGTTRNGQLITNVSPLYEGRERIAVSSPISFQRTGDEFKVFSMIAEEFSNLRIFYTCYSFVAAASGSIDAGVCWNLQLWDFAATKVLVEEAGGVFKIVRKLELPNGVTRYSAVYGKEPAVAKILDLLRPYLE